MAREGEGVPQQGGGGGLQPGVRGTGLHEVARGGVRDEGGIEL